MNAASVEPHSAGLAETTPPGGGSWTRGRWLTLVALVFAAHLLLLFAFGGRKQVVPRAVTNVPTLNLTADSGEWFALNDPTLFALPHRNDFASAIWLPAPSVNPPPFRWTEKKPRWLQLSADELGLAFNQFMQTNRFASFELQLKPPVKLSAPELPAESALAQTSTLQIQDDLAQRRLLDPIILPSWPYANVIAPSKVQLLVNEAGDVVSAVLLPPDSGYAADQYDQADLRALELARAVRFAPASRLTVGEMIFNWHTVPPPDTNPPAALP